jgi:L-fuculose-phosphate aldolase
MENTMTNATHVEKIKSEILTAARILTHRRLCEAFGHVSARIPGTDHVIITPKSSMALIKTADDLAVVDLDGNIVSGNKKPPLEAWLHTCIYQRRKDVGSIARTHSLTTSAFGILGESIKPVHDFGAILLKETPVFLDSRLIETREIGNELANFIGENGTAALLRGNGTAVLGKHVMEATLRAVYLEESALLQFTAKQIGMPIYFSEDETRRRGRQLLEANHLKRAWNHYKNESEIAL